MEVTVEETGTFDRTVTVRIKAERVNQLLDEELQRLAENVKLPGFRPGKTPKKFLESRFRDHLNGVVIENILRESYSKTLADNNLRPAANPDIKPATLLRNQDFVYVMTLQTIPDVVPTGYQGLTLTRRVVKVMDENIDAAIDKIREQHAKFEPVTGRQAASGDQIVFNFQGFVDNEPFEGGTAENYELELGSGRFIPGFEDQLIGATIGKELDVNVTFPEKYGSATLAGKEALFKCTITQLRERVLPPVNDDLATLVNIQEGGLAKLREELMESLEKEALTTANKQLQKQIHELILQANPLELPDQLVTQEQKSMVEQAKKDYHAQGMDPTTVGLTDEIMATGFKETAIKRVKLGLLLGAIALKENLQVDEATVTARVNQIAASYGTQANNFRKWLQSDESHMDGIRASVLEDTMIDWVIQNSTVTDQMCTLEELMHQNEEK